MTAATAPSLKPKAKFETLDTSSRANAGCYCNFVLRALSRFTVMLCVVGTTCRACSCVERNSCGPQRYLDEDFVGEVVSRQILPADGKISTFLSDLTSTRTYKMHVIESFRGGQSTGSFVSVRTGLGGGYCGYEFVIGAKYLIDASKQGDVFATSICSRTAPLAQSEAELRILRVMAAGQRLPDFSGVLVRESDDPDKESRTPLPGVPIEVTQAGGGAPLKATTDAYGIVTFAHLPEGQYRIKVGLSVGLGVWYTDDGRVIDDQIPMLLVRPGDSGPAACNFHIFVGPSGSVGGIVKFADGKPVEGWVNADTVTQNDKPWNTVASENPAKVHRRS